MRNMAPSEEFSDYNEQQTTKKVDVKHYTPDTIEDQVKLDHLIDTGFQWDEAVTLLTLREQLYENAEMKQRVSDDYRMHFVKWLYEQGLLDEGDTTPD